ncbi:glucosamine-6-phosphate deaminase [Quadrisphaera granulorum]|uniref:Glucosamine-6-phosphate deaminase n=1 Tax=Quadrisphaera granulorum TaxID=317664 RepID=A0A315ZPZ8_9ACTN|nr:6-phosphogluconolactonase [Quadrisphaera granulorum]PWJ47596.1 glucosamine-6-phosphate deaminase [Quadrisphaera granulorum]SZE98726.1 glucosamine-6-phosphate deaminase [Quadrisphaera granulorum]
MSLVPLIKPDAESVGEHVASLVAQRLHASGPHPFLLGCPSGRSAHPTYRALARRAAAGLDVSRLVVVLMDEYLQVDASGFSRIDPQRSYSCLGFGEREILAPLAAACAAAGTTPPREIWVPDPNDPDEYDHRISAAGGVDLFLLATGATDGHIALNQPGTARAAMTHVAALGEATRRDNMGTFAELTSLEKVPTHGVTVGVDTIASLSREVVMIVTGEHKRTALQRIAAADSYDPTWPSTIAVECKAPTLVADLAAATG